MKLLLASIVISGTAYVFASGSLTPTNTPAPTMRTLDEIYDAAAASTDPNLVLPLPTPALVTGADMIHMSLSGETQGDIYGSCTKPGKVGTTVVSAYSHELISPRDAATGLPTGKRQHTPVIITMRIDKCTPQIYYALVNNENLPDVRFQFWRRLTSTTEEQYFTVELLNASVADIKIGPRDQMEVSFCYQKIIWTWMDGGISAEDDWEAPIAATPEI